MVKIVEKTLEELANEKKFEDCLEITKNIVKGKEISELSGFFTVYGPKGIIVYPIWNDVTVFNEKYFDAALKLAKAYEVGIGQEFTLKKEY